MNWFWKDRGWGIYTAGELQKKLGLDRSKFLKLMELEAERYKRSILTRGKEYYEAKLSEDPRVAVYGLTPMFAPHPMKTKRHIFNDESGVFLEKKWSRRNKYNEGKDLPFDFIFKP